MRLQNCSAARSAPSYLDIAQNAALLTHDELEISEERRRQSLLEIAQDAALLTHDEIEISVAIPVGTTRRIESGFAMDASPGFAMDASPPGFAMDASPQQ
jgi:hypothetical protein